MRSLLFVLACLAATPAAAQTSADASPEVTRASAALAAIWRPVQAPLNEASLTAACRGAREEMDAVESALPPVLTVDSLARVHTFHSLLIVPTQENPAAAFFFPSPDMAWFSPGLGAISVLSETEGFVVVRDAQEHDIAVQIGSAANTRMLRIRVPGSSNLLTFVGCASTTPR